MNRLLELEIHAIIMRPIRLLKNYVTKKLEVTEKSSTIDKLKVNFLAGTPLQILVYGTILATSQAITEQHNLKRAAYA